MNKYFRNLKQSAYNLLLDIFALEKPMTKEEWAIYIVNELEDKVSKLYESGELNYYTEEFNPNPEIGYALSVIRDNLNTRLANYKHISISQYNILCKEIASEYVNKLFNKELDLYKGE